METYSLTVKDLLELLKKCPGDMPVYKAMSGKENATYFVHRVSICSELDNDDAREYVLIN